MGMSIGDWGAKIKRLGDLLLERDVFIAIVFVLAVLSAFALGRLSAKEVGGGRAAVRIVEPAAAQEKAPSRASQAASPANQAVTASGKGQVYYHAWCSGADRLSPANKITFSTAAEAEKAGYRLAKNCPGL